MQQVLSESRWDGPEPHAKKVVLKSLPSLVIDEYKGLSAQQILELLESAIEDRDWGVRAIAAEIIPRLNDKLAAREGNFLSEALPLLKKSDL